VKVKTAHSMNEVAPEIMTGALRGADREMKPWHRLPATTIMGMSYHWPQKTGRDG